MTKTKIQSAIEAIEKSFITELKKYIPDISKDIVCTINTNNIEIGIKADEEHIKNGWKMAFSSGINFYERKNYLLSNKKNEISYEINFPASGSFDPSNQISYWRTIHAASLLKNWDIACEIAGKHIKMFNDLMERSEKEFLKNNSNES